ncbi:galactoside alpha-(1,2)-fucosyltransferase 1-like isoform X2 [Pollicipes pollicipes]|nr:galactoside alpha-(1,2)-fucosyltransferase 1-like isoform X2 [Pollicipes pollicipes]
MGEYASIFALALRYNMTAVATPSLLRFMRHMFPDTTLPVVSDACAERHTATMVDAFEQLSDEERRAHSWRIDYYPHRVRLFWSYRRQLCDEFTVRPELSRHAQIKLLEVSQGRAGLTFVGVHVRRTDYAAHLKSVFHGNPVHVSFYTSAMALCRKRYTNTVFIVTSDDLHWCREHLLADDVYVIGDSRAVTPGPELDLALLAACNHTVFDYGTYGFFGAFLAGGDMILADGFSELEHEIVTELRLGGINATFLDPRGRLLPHCRFCT